VSADAKLSPRGASPDNKQLKAIDAPIEVLIFDPLTRPVAPHLARAVGPLTLTAAAFISRMAGAVFILQNAGVAAAAFLFVGFYLDALDGKVARIRGDRIGIHGTADFLLDQVALMVVLIVFVLHRSTDDAFDLAVLVFTAVYLVYTAIGGTRLRILGDLGIDWKTPQSLRQAQEKFGVDGAFSSSGAIGLYLRLQERARKHRLLLRTTGIEAQFVALIVTPLVGMSMWTLVAAIALLLPDLAAMSIATVRLALVEDQVARTQRDEATT
jgi:hypothetical protein